MGELEQIKQRAAERLEAFFVKAMMPPKDVTGYGPGPTIVSEEHAEAERDLGRAIKIAEELKELLGPDHGRVVVETAFATRILREQRDQARADVLKLRDEFARLGRVQPAATEWANRVLAGTVDRAEERRAGD